MKSVGADRFQEEEEEEEEAEVSKRGSTSPSSADRGTARRTSIGYFPTSETPIRFFLDSVTLGDPAKSSVNGPR